MPTKVWNFYILQDHFVCVCVAEDVCFRFVYISCACAHATALPWGNEVALGGGSEVTLL